MDSFLLLTDLLFKKSYLFLHLELVFDWDAWLQLDALVNIRWQIHSLNRVLGGRSYVLRRYTLILRMGLQSSQNVALISW